MDTRLALMTGVDIPIEACKLVIHQPTLKEISYIGEADFFTATQCLMVNKSMVSQDESVLNTLSNFQVFMTIMNEKDTVDKKKSVLKIFSLLFPQYKVTFTPQTIIFVKDGQNLMVDNNNFDAMQDILKKIFCAKNGPMDQQAFNPGNEKAREIAEKLMRGRQRVAAQKGASNTSVFGMYISILSVGLHLPIDHLINLTMFQLYDLVERYSLYMNWDLDIRVRMAGGTPDSTPESWMKDLHKE